MSEVPYDVIHNILSRLPAKDLFRLRAVCKSWKRIIDDPFFVKSQTILQQSYAANSILIRKRDGGRLFSLSLDCLNYADVGIQRLIHRSIQRIGIIPMKQLIHRDVPRLASLPAPVCNGLILISHWNISQSWSIWNPLVQDFHKLPPPPPLAIDPSSENARSGFGYDEASDDYKVVRVDRMYKKVNEYYRTMIYSLKLRCWRVIQGFPGRDCWGDRGVFVHGSLHWRSSQGIIVLHLGREDHTLVAPPPSNGRRSWQSLDALDGCLIWSHGHGDFRGIDAWVMKEYGIEKSWTKLFSVKSELVGPRLVGYLKSKGQVFLGNWDSLHWLDIEGKFSRKITIFSGGVQLTSLAFAQFSPGSLLRLDNTKSRKAGGAKRRWNEGGYAWLEQGVYPAVNTALNEF